MAAPRKVFRIEETAAARLPRRIAAIAPPSPRHDEALQAKILQELATLHASLAAPPVYAANADGSARAETERLATELNLIQGVIGGSDNDSAGSDGAQPQAGHLTRTAHELEAVVHGTALATQKILAAAEQIDQAANNLTAALDGKIEQGQAQDIQDLVIQIFEACNFQDLIGQRVTKVMATLEFIEDHITRVLEEIKNAPPARQSNDAEQQLHGPRLDRDPGHVSQSEIDAMFSGNN
jgi:chemotaxis protein CheZ